MDNAWTIISTFRRRHGKAHESRNEVGPPWNDGSIVSSLVAMIEIQGMVHNGAWAAVYLNGIGWMVPIAAAGYVAVGCPEREGLAQRAIAAVRAAEELWPHVPHDSDEWLSDQLMELAGNELESIDDAWTELDRNEDLYDAIAKFIVDRRLLDEQ